MTLRPAWKLAAAAAVIAAAVGAFFWMNPPNAASAAGRPTGPSPAWQGRGMAQTSEAVAIDLLEREVVLSLPRTTLPPSAVKDVRVDLGPLKAHEMRGATWYEAELPFPIPERTRFGDGGLTLSVDGEPFTFTIADPFGAAPGSWRVLEGKLAIFASKAPKKAVMERPGASRDVARLEPGMSGLEDGAYAPYRLTLKAQTRPGLLLPAPASATWQGVSVPAGGHFRAFAALALATGHVSDGATFVVELVAAGAAPVEVHRTTVEGKGERYVAIDADLGAYAGQTVDLVVRTEAGATTDADWAFLGTPVIDGTPNGRLRRILVVGLDTTKPDHFGINGYTKPTTTELDAWAEDAVIFDRAWTSAPRTRPSFRAATTGRLPLDAVCAPPIAEASHDAGFATAGIVANIHLNPHFGFDAGSDLWWLDGKALVDDQVERALRWLDVNQNRDVFLFVHVMDPHIFYRAPDAFVEAFTKDLPPLPKDQELPKFFNRWQVLKWDRAGELTDLQKQHIAALYDAELAFTSQQLRRLLDAFERPEHDNLVIVHNDHGEELWEHGGFEHNHTLYNDVTAGLLWVKPPGGSGRQGVRSLYPATLQDIAPTAYAFAGLTATPPTDGVSLLPVIRGETSDAWDRPIPIGHLQYDADRWGVVLDDMKYVVLTGSGKEELYDLARDPAERDNLAGRTDTARFQRALAEAHKMDVGPGWRVSVQAQPGATLEVTLPEQALAAGVIDPEHITRKPANQEWGEVPKALPADVGTVTLSTDGRTLQFTAGAQGRGVLWVRFDGDVAAPGTVVRGGGGVTSEADASGVVKVGGDTMTFAPGVVVVPPASEWTRMQACMGQGETSDETVCQLCSLGYLNGPTCAGCGGGAKKLEPDAAHPD